MVSTAPCAASRKEPSKPRPETSSAKATDASGRTTATTEISVTLVGSANDLRCFAAASDCREPSVATMTCISDSLHVVEVGRLRTGPLRAEELLGDEQHPADGEQAGTPDERVRVVVDGEPEDREVAEEPEEQQRPVGTEDLVVLVLPGELEAG